MKGEVATPLGSKSYCRHCLAPIVFDRTSLGHFWVHLDNEMFCVKREPVTRPIGTSGLAEVVEEGEKFPVNPIPEGTIPAICEEKIA